MMIKIYISVRTDSLDEPLRKRILIGENTSREGMQWEEFLG